MAFDIREHFKKEEVLDKGYIELTDGMVSDPLLKIVNSARVSFQKESTVLTKKDKQLINYLYEHKHFSTFRHSYFTFRVGAPLFCFKQWWKHQIGSDFLERDIGEVQMPETNWNEVSGRYVEWKPEFYIPAVWRGQSDDNKQGSSDVVIHVDDFEDKCNRDYDYYKSLLDRGVAKEMARMVLPPNLYSECIWTVSLQGLLYWLDLRSDSHAQWEIRQYANAIVSLMSGMLGDMVE